MFASNMIALASAMVVLAAIPSPSVLLVVARAIASGFHQGFAVVVGIVCGDLLFILLALNGLGAIADLSWFKWIQWLGAAYLIWMGGKLWQAKIPIADSTQDSTVSLGGSLMSGFFITISDPKAILFYVSFFPAYVNLSALTFGQSLIIAAIAMVSVGGAKSIYAFMGGKAQFLFRNANAMTVLNRIASVTVFMTGGMILLNT